MKKAITEIRGQDTAELKGKLSDLRKEQFGLRFRYNALGDINANNIVAPAQAFGRIAQ